MNLHKKALLHSIAVACLLAACGGGGDAGTANDTTAGTAGNGNPVVADEVLVRLHRASDLPALLGQYGLAQLGQFGSRPIYRLGTSRGADPEALAAQLAADARVRYAEPNLVSEAPESRRRRIWAVGGDAGTYAAQWNNDALRLPEAHAISTGSGVTVAVLDTGVDAAHPALAGRLVAGFDFVDFDADPSEQGAHGADAGYGHGTHVASLVAQVAPAARIMPIRVLDRSGAGNVWVLSEALLHAVDPDGDPTTDDGAQVINLSLGTTRPTQVLEDILDTVTCKDDDNDTNDPDDDERCNRFGGAVVAAAAGNSGNSTRHYPAAEKQEGVIAVAASTSAGRLWDESTRGDWVHVAAPGHEIYGAVPGGWGVWSGTSMAAPMVAGAAALLVAHEPTWKPSDVASKLQSNGRALCGTGLKQVDAASALNGTSGPSISCQ